MSLPSSRKFATLSLAVIAFTFFFAATSSAQQPKVLAPHTPVAPRLPRHREWDPKPVAQSAAGALWMTDGNFKSTLYLSNMLKEDSLPVTPIIHLANGVAYALPEVTLEPSGTATIDINHALADKGIASYATLSGYVEIQYTWGWAAVCGSVWNVDTKHSLIFVYSLRQPPSNPTQQATSAHAQPEQTLEGMWWKQEPNVTGFVGLSNLTARPITASVETLDAGNHSIATHTVTISPNGTKIVELNELLSTPASAGGVVVTWIGNPNELAVNSSLQDAAAGYSARLPLGAPPDAAAKISQDSVAELGLMNGPADSMMNFPASVVFAPYSLLRNLSEQAVTVTPTLWWMQSGSAHSYELSKLTAPPHQTIKLDLPASLRAAGPGNLQGSFNLALDSDGPKGALLLAAGSVDQTFTYVFESVPRGVGQSASRGLQYWSTGNGDDTMVTLWNPADEAQDFVFTLFYSGGHYVYPIHLEPRATHSFNVSEIIHSSIPDSQGNVIPAGIQSGSAEIAGFLGENQDILAAIDLGIYNVRKATCGNYYCTTCNGEVTAAVNANPFPVPVGGSTQETFEYQYNTGTQYNVTSTSNWSSSNTAIATVTGGLTNGVSVGSVAVTAYYSGSVPVFVVPCAYNYVPPCPSNYISPTGTGSGGSTPRIDSITPTQGTVGTTVTPVTISGQGFGNDSTKVTVSAGSGITVTINSVADNKIVASFAIAPNATLGTNTVSVSVVAQDGTTQPSNGVSFGIAPSISSSGNLWFFGTGVQTPSGFTLGGTSATLTAGGTGSSGTFQWSVTAGTSELAFSNGTQSINITNSNTVIVYSSSYSTAQNDVTVQLVFTPTGGVQAPTATFGLTIDSPYQLLLGTLPAPSGVSSCQPLGNPPAGNGGWVQFIPYTLKSRFNVTMSNTTVNEALGPRSDVYSGNTWAAASPNSVNTNASGAFRDELCQAQPTATPPSQPPQSPLLNVLVYTLGQTWQAGITTPGLGLQVQSDTINKYTDHGTVSAIKSPVN